MDKRRLALCMIGVFLVGWLSFSYYLYSNQILVISIEGEITDFEYTTLALYDGMIDNNVKAVILYLNTPGGLAYPCLEIASYVQDLAQVKPVIAVMGAYCASGGYYIASYANYIYTRENTLTGGIGVLSVWVDMSEYYENQGIKIWLWQKGEKKDLGAEWRAPTPEENASIQETVDTLFNQLITDIQRNRNLTDNTIAEVGSGTVYLGSDAQYLGLTDEIGNILNAIERAVEMVGLWRYILVSIDMTDYQRFLKAMIF